MGRPKLERVILQARVNQDTPEKLKQMALDLGFQWGANGNTGKFLDAIAAIPTEKIKYLIIINDDD
ncbi:MAG: hypothetical protein ACRC2S_15430 [Waterburya sp.]